MELVIWLVCVVLLALVVGGYAIVLYNGLVRARNAWQNAFAQIDVQLKRRHDLVPNLVEVAKEYMKHERETLEAVVAARGSAAAAQATASAAPGDPAAMQQLAGAEATLGRSLGRLFALAEAYPDLKANQTMMQLSEELTSTENRIAFSRQAYNDAVMGYNNRRSTFPAIVLANMFSFAPAAMFATEDPQERAAPKIQF
jgi:LemA protein